MKLVIDAVYDGEALRPQEPVELETGERYRLTIEWVQPPGPPEGSTDSFERILSRARDLGVPDLAEQHDHYLYGTPKR